MKKKITTATTIVEEIIDTTSKNLNTFILLDRSGSMSGSLWTEAVGSVNGYVEELVKNKVDGKVSIALFDSIDSFELVTDAIEFKRYKSTLEQYHPRGGTPLFDAVGKMIAKAEEVKNEKTVIVIMTDGQENQSKEFNKTTIKAAVDRVTKKGWEVVFLGANFDVSQDAYATGLGSNKFASSTVQNLNQTMRSYAQRATAYSGTMAVDNLTGTTYAAGAAFDITADDKLKSEI